HEVMQTVGATDIVDLFLPLPLGADAVNRRGDENYNLTVRLKPGVSIRQAQADIDLIASRIREKDKRDRTFGMIVMPLLDQVVGNVRRALLVLLGSVALVLLIACANVANLLLARAAEREKEIAVRTALGARWQRLVRQLMTETILLSLLGGAAGLLIAWWSVYLLRAINPGNVPRLEEIGIDGGVLAFTFAISVLTGIFFGIAPAWRAGKVDLNTALKAGGRSSQGDIGFSLMRHPLRSLLVISELAFSLMLLIGATLLIRSFVRLQEVPPGFNSDHVITMRIAANAPKYRDEKNLAQFFREIGQSVAHLPGVRMQGTVSALPLTPSVGWGQINVEGFQPKPGQELQVDLRVASTDYFRAMQIPLKRGRFFSNHDTLGSQLVVLVDEKFAQRFWPHENPIGKHVWFAPKKPMTIAGVVGAVKQYGLETEGRIVVYFPQEQNPTNAAYLAAKTTSDPSGLAGAIVREVHAVDRDVPVYDIQTMQRRLSDSLARQRFSTTMLGAFALFALVLAAVGVYGVISYLVTQGAHDIGIRMALGAEPGNIGQLVVGQGMRLALIGIGAGVVGALGLTRVMASLLFGVSPTDISTFAGMSLMLAIIAVLATLIPAQRSMRIDPMVALRQE
ncbi:MAG TPA: ABC transporter permease, partial [Bryobacteraceae bacterium]|nr:ABC transporter permease [Bryobacteraceae bacterium]